MKTRFVPPLLLAVSVILATNRSFAENLIQNGSFEVNNSYSGWGFSGGGLLVLGGAGAGVQCANGYNAVGLSWQTTLYQDVLTVVGQQYRFSFYMANWGPDYVPSNTVYLTVSIGSTTLGTVSFDGAGKTYQNMGWRKFEYIVTAANATTRIAFFNPAAPLSVGIPMIDDVRLTAVDSGQTTKAGGKVAAWGNNSSGQILVPNGFNNVKQIAAGNSHSLALKADGTVVGWGNNAYGAANAPAGLSGILAIAAGSQHSLALRANGTVVAWGDNAYGQANVPAYLSDVIQISAGSKHSLALKADGTVVGWGGGSYGEAYVPVDLSNVKAVAAGVDASLVLKRDGSLAAWGSTVNGGVPVGLSNVVAIASGTYQNLALKADGTVVAWGIGYSGQTSLPPGLSNVVAVSVGTYQSLALKADGTPVAWGLNNYGLTNIPVGLSNVTAIAAGGSHNLAIVPDGPPEIVAEPGDIGVPYQSNFVLTVEAHGFEPLSYRWLFKGLTLSDSTRVSGSRTTSLTISNAQFADAGSYRVAVGNALGTVQSTGATVTVISPPIFTQQPAARTVTAGTNITLNAAVIGTPPLSYQWLLNDQPIAGATQSSLSLSNIQSANAGTYSVIATNAYGLTQSSNVVVSVTETAPYILAQPANRWASVGGEAAFFVNARGTAPLSYQWQRDGSDIPGATNSTLTLTGLRFEDERYYTVAVSNAVGVTVSAKAFLAVSHVAVWGSGISSALTKFPPGLSNVVAVAAGDSHVIALKADGTVAAWGNQTLRITNPGHFPTNTTVVETNSPATNVPPNLSGIIAISAGTLHNLALKADGTVVAWGDNRYGQTNVPTGLSNVIAIAAGANNSLALREDSTIVAWGGYGPPILPYSTPLTNLPTGLSNVTAIAVGNRHGMAVKSDGQIVVWPGGDTPPGVLNIIAVAFGRQTTDTRDDYLALRVNGTVAAWSDRYVTLPDGYSTISGLSNVVAIAPGPMGLMALRSDGSVYISRATNQPPQNVSNVTAIASGGGYSARAYGGVISQVIYPASEFYVAVVGNGSPAFTLQPASQLAGKGGQARMHARAAGVQPLRYQWQLNGMNLLGATNADLTMTNVQAANAGSYRVVAANALGTATSTVAKLMIPFNTSWASALNATNLVWISTNAPWFAEIQETHDGDVAAQSGYITHNQQSTLQTTVTGPGMLSFWWKVSSEQGYDFLRLFLDASATPLAGVSGETDWQQVTIPITTGSHTTKWVYSKDATVSAGQDAGWLDEVIFTPLPPPVQNLFIGPPVRQPDGTVELTVNSSQPSEDIGRCEVQVSTNLTDWETLPGALTLTNGSLLLRDNESANHPARFYRIIEH